MTSGKSLNGIEIPIVRGEKEIGGERDRGRGKDIKENPDSNTKR